MTTIINGSSPSITFSDGSAQTSATRPFLNRIINGSMTIDQRNAGAAVTIDQTGGTYTLDRWYGRDDSDGAYSIQQVSDAPTGFTNSLKITITTTDSSLSASQYGFIGQWIEGFNTADLNWGTANAKTVTLSFWIKGSVTGQFGGSITNSAQNRSYPFSYTISAANTWEQKTVTITGDTTGTWLTTNGAGIGVIFAVGIGSNFLDTANIWTGNFEMSATGQTNLYATSGGTLQFTGCQLEVGSTATSFDYRPFTTELQLAQRYCYAIKASEASGAYSTFMQQGAYTTTALTGNFIPKVTMRVVPTLSTTGTASNYLVFNGTFYTLNSVPAITTDSTPSSFTVDASVSSGLTAGYVYRMTANNNNVAYLIFSAEL